MTVAALYDWLVLAHIVAAMVWVGGGVLLAVLAAGALRGGDPATVARLIGSLRVVGPAVLAPATLAVLGFGIWLVLDGEAWDFGQAWVQLALGLVVAALLVGAAHQSRATLRAERAVAAGDEGEARHQLTRWTVGYLVIIALLVVVAWDMVFKPGL